MKFHPDKISSYFLLEWKVLLCVTLTGLLYNIGSVVVIRMEGNMLQTLYDILKETYTRQLTNHCKRNNPRLFNYAVYYYWCSIRRILTLHYGSW